MKTSLLLIPVVLLLVSAPALYSAEKLTGEQVYEKGRAALAKGDLVTARQCFEQLLKARPDFDLARVQLAQVVVAERELAKIPAPLKVARRERVPRFAVVESTVSEAAAVAAKALEKAGAAEKLTVSVTGRLPEAVDNRLVTISATNATPDDILAAIGYAAGVQFNYTANGIAMREDRGSGRLPYDAGDPKQPAKDGAAKKVIIDRIACQDASPPEMAVWLQRKAAEASGGKENPIFVVRYDAAPRSSVTLDLRNISLRDALDSVCLVADLEAKWFPWGAGIGSKSAAAPADGLTEKR